MDVLRPRSLDEALRLRLEHPDALPVAGGIGPALMEELQIDDGIIRNGSFTDYVIPTIRDVPPIVAEFVEPEPASRGPAPVPNVHTQQPVPEVAGLELRQHKLMKGSA